MPKQIISDVFGELLETGKKTLKQAADVPVEMVKKDLPQQTGIRPKTEEQKKEAAQIQKLKEEDEKKKGRQIAFFKRQIADFNQPSSPQPTIQERHQQEKKAEMISLNKEQKKGLPLAVKRKATRVEIKGGISG